MKRKHIIIGTLVIISIWTLFFGFPKFILFIKPEWCIGDESDQYYNRLEIAYIAAGALFTALAFGLTFSAIILQREDTLRKTSLDVLTNTFNKIQDDPAFINALSYIRNDFKYDYEILRAKKEYRGIDGQIGIEEFIHLLKLKKEKSITTLLHLLGIKSKKEIIKSFNPYMTIRFFCDKMDYIGILLKKNYVDDVLLDYFGKTIIETYNILENLLIVSRKRQGDELFFHYKWLYDKAKKRIPKFKKECSSYINGKTNRIS